MLKTKEDVRWQFFKTIQSEGKLCDGRNPFSGLIPDNHIRRNIEAFIKNIGAEENEENPEIYSESVLEKASEIFTYMNFSPCNHHISKWIRLQFLILFEY